MRKLGFLTLIILSGCTTISNWKDSSMAWADRTMPTYESLFGEEQPQPAAQDFTQRPPVPVVPVETQQTAPTLSSQQEVYYDNSERGYSFEQPIQ